MRKKCQIKTALQVQLHDKYSFVYLTLSLLINAYYIHYIERYCINMYSMLSFFIYCVYNLHMTHECICREKCNRAVQMQVIQVKTYLTLESPCSRYFAIFWSSQPILSNLTAPSTSRSTGYVIEQAIHCFASVEIIIPVRVVFLKECQ